jgi:SAM-dependent methyltransferase
LETGAGNCEQKEIVLSRNKRVKKYIATDSSSWDNQFRKHKKEASKLGFITEILYGRTKDSTKLDLVCDACNLPFKSESFDTYASFEVVEHISDIQKFYCEAARVLKKDGRCITVSPFLYREHGGVESDFQRITRGGYQELARKSGLKLEKIYTYSFFGTTLAILINQYVIRRILEEGILTKVVLFSISPLIFFTANCFGLLMDFINNDERFASCYHVVMRKV